MSAIANKMVDLLKDLFVPAFAVLSAGLSLYAVILGVKYAKASEPQEVEKVKQQIKNIILGIMAIFFLMLFAVKGVPVFVEWIRVNMAR